MSAEPPFNQVAEVPSREIAATMAVTERCESSPSSAGYVALKARQESAGGEKRLILYHPDDRGSLSDLVCLVRGQVEVFVAPLTRRQRRRKRKKEREKNIGGGEARPGHGVAAEGGDAGGIDATAEGRVAIRCIHCFAPLPPQHPPAPPSRRVSIDSGVSSAGGSSGGGVDDCVWHETPPLSQPSQQQSQSQEQLPHQRKVKGAVLYPKSIRSVYQSVRNFQRHHMLACPSMPMAVRDEFVALKSAKWQKRSGNDSVLYWERSCARLGLVDVAEASSDDEAGGGEETGSITVLKLRMAALDGTWTEEMGKREMERVRKEQQARLGTQAQTQMQMQTQTQMQMQTQTQTQMQMRMDGSVATGSDLDLDVDLNLDLELLAGPEVDEAVVARAASSSFAAPPPASAPVQNCDDAAEYLDGVGRVDVKSSLDDETSLGTVVTGAGTGTTVTADVAPDLDVDLNPHLFVDLDTLAGLEAEVKAYKAVVAPDAPSAGVAYSPVSGPNGGRSGGSSEVTTSLSISSPPARSDCCPVAAIPIVLPREIVLERTQRAHSIVRAIAEIRLLPSHLPMPIVTTAMTATQLHRGQKREGQGREDLQSLGGELYELFSGQRLSEGGGSDASGDDDSQSNNDKVNNDIDADEPLGILLDDDCAMRSQQRRKKREKRCPEKEGREFMKLVDLGLPSALCTLVSSLLNASSDSNTDGSYRSVEDVEEDLRLMASDPDRFLFGSDSRLHHLEFPENMLYGRSTEISKLIEAYDRTVDAVATNHKNDIVLVSGYSGTGKSSLVRNVRNCFIERGARFISGKFDAMQQMQPFSAIASALNEYCDILAGDAGQIDSVRQAISDAVGSDGGVLVTLIPNLSNVLPSMEKSASPPVSALGREVQHRLAFLVRMLFRATCGQSRPVVLFLDDLQWADEASLELMHALVTDTELNGLLFVGCYRDNEVGLDHRLKVHLGEIQRSGIVTVTPIHISNLDGDSVNALVSDALHLMPRLTKSLAEVVLHKTGGNALFVVQFLVSLCDAGLLRYSVTSRKWEWDIDRIRARDIADDVVELMTAKLIKLAPEIHDAIRVAASFGIQCQDDLLRILERDTEHFGNTIDALNSAVGEGIMIKVEDMTYQFSHDQIQKAAYLLIPSSEREAFHLQVGRSLWQHASVVEVETFLFVLIDQLHRGAGLITCSDEKLNLAQLSLMAGQKASSMSAFLPASLYLRAGISLIDDRHGEHNRELCLDLYNSCAEMECILGEFESMKSHMERVLLMARTTTEKMRACYTLVHSKISQGDTNDAINTAIAVLCDLGESFPSPVSTAVVYQELVSTQKLLNTRTDEAQLRHLDLMQDMKKIQAMRFLNSIVLSAYAGNPLYLALTSCRMVRLSLSYGVCQESAVGFACYGVLICGMLGDLDGGYRYGQLALFFLNRFQSKDSLAKVYLGLYAIINNWIEPIQSSLSQLKHAVEVGQSTGDTYFAMAAAQMYHGLALCSGQPLQPLMDEMKIYLKYMVEYNQNIFFHLNKPLRQFSLNLLGASANPIKLIGEEMDEENLQENVEDVSAMFLSLVYFYRMWLEYLFGEYELAAETAAKNRDVEKHLMGRFAVVCNYNFYTGLAALAMARKEGKAKHADTIDETIDRMKIWASSSAWNCEHKLELLKAENAYLGRDFVAAASSFVAAVDLAKKHRFVHEQALALERAGIFYLETGNHAAANGFFSEAHACYCQWGALSKAAHVKYSYL